MRPDLNSPDSHAFLDICRTHALAQVDNKLGDLLHVDDIFALVRVLLILNDLGATSYLQRLLLCHPLPVGGNIPKVWRCETGVGFLRTCEREVQGALQAGHIITFTPIFSLTLFCLSLISFSSFLRAVAYGAAP